MSYVDDFMKQLSIQTAPLTRAEFKEREKSVEKISLSFVGNHGRYAVCPINTAISDYPFVTLFNTREVCIPRKKKLEDGSEDINYVWVKILPKNGYIMRDKTNRTCVTSLTSEDERLLDEAVNLFDALFDETDARFNRDILTSLVRKKHYTLFHAYCINKWNFDDSRTPARQNFGGLFICTSKTFTKLVEDNIKETVLLNGGDNNWINDIYSNDLVRKGFMMFSISMNKSNPGFSISINHKTGVPPITIPLPQEELERMKDPIENFLGWQANRDEENKPGEKRLFNAPLIKEAINFMAQQLAAVRNAKATGGNIQEAIKKTSDLAAKGAPAFGVRTNDPMLRQEMGPQVDSQRIAAQNTNPYATPPAGHFSPISGAAMGMGQQPMQQPQQPQVQMQMPPQPQAQPQAQMGMGGGFGSSPFQVPNFASGFGGGSDNSDLPF